MQPTALSYSVFCTDQLCVLAVMNNLSIDDFFSDQKCENFIKSPEKAQEDGKILHPTPDQLA